MNFHHFFVVNKLNEKYMFGLKILKKSEWERLDEKMKEFDHIMTFQSGLIKNLSTVLLKEIEDLKGKFGSLESRISNVERVPYDDIDNPASFTDSDIDSVLLSDVSDSPLTPVVETHETGEKNVGKRRKRIIKK